MKSSVFKDVSALGLTDPTCHNHFITGQAKKVRKYDINIVSCAVRGCFFKKKIDSCDTSEGRGMQSVMRPLPALAAEQLGQNHHWLFSTGNCFPQMTHRFCQQFQPRHHRGFRLAAATGTTGMKCCRTHGGTPPLLRCRPFLEPP